jgi:E3 ubiquitin-protein ligase TRIP12
MLKRKRTRKNASNITSTVTRKTRSESDNSSSLNLRSYSTHSSSNVNRNYSTETEMTTPYISLPIFLGDNSSANNNNNVTNLLSANSSVPTHSATSTRGRPAFRFSSAAAKTTAFFQSLHPARWARWNSSSPSLVTSNCGVSSGRSQLSSHSADHPSISGTSSPRSPNNSGNREKIRAWIKEQAKIFEEKYFTTKDEDGLNDTNDSNSHPSLNILNRLTYAIEMLSENNLTALQEIRSVLMEGDISSFELIHSGLVTKLLAFLVSNSDGDECRENRLRCFLHVFFGTPIDDHLTINSIDSANLDYRPLAALVSKLNSCVCQLEQFPVRVHDLVGSGSGSIRGASALKFFNTHQLKCNLQRHPECNNLRQWRGGPVKIDPLALVQAIERYLVIRGYGKIRDDDDDGSDDDISDEEFDDNMAAMMINQNQGRHRLQFLIGDQVLPFNMTVYQAIKQYGYGHSSQTGDGQETDNESETPMGHANIWVATHTIHYKAYIEGSTSSPPSSSNPLSTFTSNQGLTNRNSNNNNNNQHSNSQSNRRSNKGSGSGKGSSKKKDELWLEGKAPTVSSPLDIYLKPQLPQTVSVQDLSLEVLTLLRVIYGLNRHWGWLYKLPDAYNCAILSQEFINSKLTAKANRQLQDPLVIMTGNIPNWLSQIAYACPFLFPFDTRYLLFYVTCFDRDRALQRLLDSAPELTGSDSSERVTPRLDRRKRTVSRDDILKQAETVLHDLGSSKSLLEIQYENEVGTGLGPTLEFYALVSKELQRADLEMWRGEAVSSPKVVVPQPNHKITATSSTSSNENLQINQLSNNANNQQSVQYIYSPTGLFPAPIGRNAKAGLVSKSRQRFKLLGKFVAKALMDSRMVCRLTQFSSFSNRIKMFDFLFYRLIYL